MFIQVFGKYRITFQNIIRLIIGTRPDNTNCRTGLIDSKSRNYSFDCVICVIFDLIKGQQFDLTVLWLGCYLASDVRVACQTCMT